MCGCSHSRDFGRGINSPGGIPQNPETVRCICALKSKGRNISCVHSTKGAPPLIADLDGVGKEEAIGDEAPTVWPRTVGAEQQFLFDYPVLIPCLHFDAGSPVTTDFTHNPSLLRKFGDGVVAGHCGRDAWESCPCASLRAGENVAHACYSTARIDERDGLAYALSPVVRGC